MYYEKARYQYKPADMAKNPDLKEITVTFADGSKKDVVYSTKDFPQEQDFINQAQGEWQQNKELYDWLDAEKQRGKV